MSEDDPFNDKLGDDEVEPPGVEQIWVKEVEPSNQKVATLVAFKFPKATTTEKKREDGLMLRHVTLLTLAWNALLLGPTSLIY